MLRGIAPGTYKLLAFDDVDFEELVTRPEILKPYEPRSKRRTTDESYFGFSACVLVINDRC